MDSFSNSDPSHSASINGFYDRKNTVQSNDKEGINLEKFKNSNLSPDDLLSVIQSNARAIGTNGTCNNNRIFTDRIDKNINNKDINGINNNNNNKDNNLNHHNNINNYYSLNVNTIPPYVLSRLTHGLDTKKNEICNEDPFTSSFKDDKNMVQWGDFLNTIKIPTSSIPVKTSLNDLTMDDIGDRNSVNNDNIFNDTQTYFPLNDSKDHQLSTDRIFKKYDLHSRWKGDLRLKELFESPDIVISDDYTDTDETSLHSNNDNNTDLNNENLDLEKGYKHKLKKHRNNIRLNRRERDIRDRAKYWLRENNAHWKPKLLESIMTNSYFPLFFRLISINLCTVALGLSARIVKVTGDYHITQQSSPLMAMIVHAIALFYLFYITYDEFTSQPLGLRDPTAKIRLVLFDLLFIIFSAANLSLSFQSIYDNRWVCTATTSIDDILYDPDLCKKVKALTAFLFVTLVVWCINFTISIFRIVHVVSYSRDKS